MPAIQVSGVTESDTYSCRSYCLFIFLWWFSNNFNFLPESLGTIDFVEKGTGSVAFRTCSEERNQVVFQIGTSNAVRALTAAQLV